MNIRAKLHDGTARTHLEGAASLLDGVGHADPHSVDPGVALLCLAGADQLSALVGQPARVHVDGRHVDEAVAQALAHLAALPMRAFAAEPVLEAASYARRAHAMLT
jgi:hypothetical protein